MQRIPIRKRFGRAMLLHCPRCGGGGIRRSWFRFHERCPHCGLALERGESGDYWLGAYAINLVITETLALLIALACLAIAWPNSTPAEWIGVAAAIGLPILFFPWSRTLWLAWDMSFRPSEEGDDLQEGR
jgi:uncharacterized protein (DUF983 family)